MSNSCALCGLNLPKNPVVDEERAFCCSGCLTVFTIVGSAHNYQNHPLFQTALQAGVISNPELQEQMEAVKPNTPTLKYHLQIEEMWCPSCAEAIELILLKQKGIHKCKVDYATDLALIEYDPCLRSKESIQALIEKIGYRAQELLSSEKQQFNRSLWLRFGVAAFCMLNIMMFAYPLYISHFGISVEGYEITLGWLSLLMSIPLLGYCALPIWRRLIVSFKSRLFGMETLVFISVSTALSLSVYSLVSKDFAHLYFDSMSMVVTFLIFGKILEKKAKFSAKETLFRLTRTVPKKGYKLMANGEYLSVPLKEISSGDHLFVRTGEKIVLDGVVVEGSALVDESVMTGEALPVLKKEGGSVIGGSILKQGTLKFEVTKDQTHSLLGQILTLIENDLTTKNRMDRLVDRITRYFIPVVLGLAFAALVLIGPIRALTVLLIACPCALGIAVPLVHSRLLFGFAEKGALVRNRNAFMQLAQNPLFVFDKTGTLTEGKFQVLKGLEQLKDEDKAVLKSMASHSSHPICSVIYSALSSVPAQLAHATENVGRGIEAAFQGCHYLLGSSRFCKEKGVQFTFKEHLATVVYFVKNQQVLTEIHLGDQLRSGLPKVEGVILSGDSPKLVSAVAKECGFKWGKGGLDPLQKREEILRLKKQETRPIIMVGDGVNDAPAMAVADLGISVVTATDLAAEVSDILLTTDYLDALPQLAKLAKKGKRIMYQNLFWAFFYNSVGVILALFGVLSPLFAALAMVLSSLCVSINSIRVSAENE